MIQNWRTRSFVRTPRYHEAQISGHTTRDYVKDFKHRADTDGMFRYNMKVAASSSQDSKYVREEKN